ncbi:MAG: hypothetical protein V7K76_32845 [Nostoc sp.]|uniref:hypothetical protein n=1 Tax=Nostoc sp. TaxID=1180 RepID=UPI002FF4907F
MNLSKTVAITTLQQNLIFTLIYLGNLARDRYKVGLRNETQHLSGPWVYPAGRLRLRKASTQPCILEIVVDRPNLGHHRPLRSMGHYNNLFDRTRTVAGVKALNTLLLKYTVCIGQG